MPSTPLLFEDYSKDSEVVELYKKIEPRATEDDQWPGTLTTLGNLRRAISEGENYGDAFHSELSDPEKTAAFDHIVQLMEQEIEALREKQGASQEDQPAGEESEGGESSEGSEGESVE